MKYFYCLLTIITLVSCSSNDETEPTNQINLSFLNEIRPNYFNTLNFNKAATISEIPEKLKSFKASYDDYTEEYENGVYQSSVDLENMRLASMYYSFFIQAVVKAHLDGIITFEDIKGNSTEGLFSKTLVRSENFKDLELNAMMETAEKVSLLALDINGLNDRAYGFYLGVKQTQERLKNTDYFNEEKVQDLLIQYVQEEIEDTTFFTEWNVIMTLVFFDDYNDPLNGYDNPKMNIVLKNVTDRLNPEVLPEDDINYIGLLGPVYILDLITKKLDHTFNNSESISAEELEQINFFVNTLFTVKDIILNDRTVLYNSWDFKETVDLRFQKMQEIKSYVNDLNSGINSEIPELNEFFKTRDFRQAYQCYSCHASPN
ncbi:hypothetical protein [Ascidiimonas sp. W6]|uniref:hypothetical protein n=1 Tax=Ascidiimonas meishanensis TaxID=3128903 RepID=UPI0030EEACD7